MKFKKRKRIFIINRKDPVVIREFSDLHKELNRLDRRIQRYLERFYYGTEAEKAYAKRVIKRTQEEQRDATKSTWRYLIHHGHVFIKYKD